jgi:iron complex transport system permease protein
MLLAGCLFAGPALLISADTVARLALSPVQIPVGIVTGVLGGGFFLYLMRRKREFGRL